jgi:hypothetical protein
MNRIAGSSGFALRAFSKALSRSFVLGVRIEVAVILHNIAPLILRQHLHACLNSSRGGFMLA